MGPEIKYDTDKADETFAVASRYNSIPLPRASVKVVTIINLGDANYENVDSYSLNHDEKNIKREDLLKQIIKMKQGLNKNFHDQGNVRQIKVWDFGSSIFKDKHTSSLFSALICHPLNKEDECTKFLIATDLAYANSLAVEYITGKQLIGIELRAAKIATRMLFEEALPIIRKANIKYLNFATGPEAIAARNTLLNPDNIDKIVNLLFEPNATKHLTNIQDDSANDAAAAPAPAPSAAPSVPDTVSNRNIAVLAQSIVAPLALHSTELATIIMTQANRVTFLEKQLTELTNEFVQRKLIHGVGHEEEKKSTDDSKLPMAPTTPYRSNPQLMSSQIQNSHTAQPSPGRHS